MIVENKVHVANGRVRFRSVALPFEHGGWGLLFEPILLGLLVAPSRAGLFVSAAATVAFLARHPFKLAMTDWHRQRITRRTHLARRFAIAYGLISIFSISLAIKTSGKAFLLPLLLATPIATIQLIYDSVGRSRALMAELAGSIATGTVATAVAICSGWPRPPAFALWVIVAARAVPTVLYLRARLRLRRHKPASTRIAIGAHVVAAFLIGVLAWKGTAPWLGVLAMAILLVRASIGLVSTKRVTPQRLGITELLFGAFTIAVVSFGFALRW